MSTKETLLPEKAPSAIIFERVSYNIDEGIQLVKSFNDGWKHHAEAALKEGSKARSRKKLSLAVAATGLALALSLPKPAAITSVVLGIAAGGIGELTARPHRRKSEELFELSETCMRHASGASNALKTIGVSDKRLAEVTPHICFY